MKEKITRYSNVDAHNAIKQLMLRGERLVVRFFSENTQYLPCALVGTDNVKAFKYVIYQNSFDWLMGYLMCGKSYMEDIDAKPIMTVEEAEHIQDFQFHVLEMFRFHFNSHLCSLIEVVILPVLLHLIMVRYSSSSIGSRNL